MEQRISSVVGFFYFFYIFEYSPSIDHLQSCRHGIAVCVILSKLDYCNVPLLDCPKSRLNVYRQYSMLLQELYIIYNEMQKNRSRHSHF